MNWIWVLVIAVIVTALVLLKRLGQLNKSAASDYLRKGAKVVDVRTPSEFQSNHLAEAINIPLGEIEQRIRQQVPDKEQLLLLHCLSGTRSAIAVRTLKRLGYVRAFNLGSYRRAERIVSNSLVS